jgi:CheY-like chemotaxis protein
VKILIVEDDRVTAHMYGEWLRKAGHEINIAKTGPEAVAQVGLWEPDALLLDVLLPDLNGIAVLKRIRKEAAELPVVICTNAYNPTMIEQALAAGATRVFEKSKLKPFDLVSEFNAHKPSHGRRRAA